MTGVQTCALPISPLADPGRQDLYERLTRETRCLVCQNETIADSTAPLAADLRREIRRLVSEGKSEDDIKDFLLQRYGDFVLYKPRMQTTTAVLWVAPGVFLVGVMLIMITIIRRRSRLPADLDADDAGDNPASKRSQ